MQNFTAFALCAIGAEKIVSNELKKLGLKAEDSRSGRVRFQSDTAGLYRSLMGLRAADRVLLEAASFAASDFEALFQGAQAAPWETLIPRGTALSVTKVRARASKLSAETSVQAVVHKAAAEKLCKAYGVGRLPDGTGCPKAELRVYLEKDRASVLLDLSGEPLFKRGYRTEGGAAPLRETTAAAILLLSGWRRKFPLWDPFCGSGTILNEAALFAWDAAPGLRRRFAIEHLGIADAEIEKAVRRDFAARIDTGRLVRLSGSDTDAPAVEAALANAERVRDITGDTAAELPKIRVQAMEDARPPLGDPGFIVTNPPYGRRLGDPAEAEKTYARMSRLADHFPGWKLAVICDHPGFESFLGKKADSCREITNGALQSYLYQYEKL